MQPPPTLPTYIFLMSDTSTRQLACDVAQRLAEADVHVFPNDFLSPIHEAFSAMFELDLKRDLASPSVSNRLLIPHGDGEQTEADYIISLETWFCDQFGPNTLGQIAYKSTQAMRADFDYSFVFRDANVNYIRPFISNVGWHKLLFVRLEKSSSLDEKFPVSRLIVAQDKTCEEIVKAIMEFDA